jgi:hypothetical protein
MTMRLFAATMAFAVSAWTQSSGPMPAPGNVALPLDEYNKLLELAAKPAKTSEAPPLLYALKSAHLNLQVNGESVTGSVSIEGQTFGAGDQKVPLVSGMVVLDAQQTQGKDLPLQHENGSHFALLSGPAEFSITLHIGLPLTIETGRAAFHLQAPTAAAVRLTLSVPGDQTLVNLTGGLITGRSFQDGRTLVDASLNGGQTAQVWWAARMPAGPPAQPKEARFLSDVKTLVSVRDADIAMATLAEITVVQGEPAEFELRAPEGFELTGATGATLLSSESSGTTILLRVGPATSRSHQFLISLSRPNAGTAAEFPLPAFAGAQRETGEVLVEGEGAMELNASESGGLHRMDVKEASGSLLSLGRGSVRSAFRYQKRPGETPALHLGWDRFPDGPMVSAIAERAMVTTMVTSEGRSLTEVKLTLKNRSQPFLKVALPPGANILSSDVAGEKVKPVTAPDGARVPLLRAGFHPAGSYVVSFVFLDARTPFSKKGEAELSLPKMDLPIALVEWELYVPLQYKVGDFKGDATSERLLPVVGEAPVRDRAFGPGRLGGIVTDSSGAAIPNVAIKLVHDGTRTTRNATTDRNGRWLFTNVDSGRVHVVATAAGFNTSVRELTFDASRGAMIATQLNVGGTNETITVTAESPMVQTSNASVSGVAQNGRQKDSRHFDQEASANVADLQRRVVGVLPIAINVPRTGASYRFVRPLVVDEETKVSFNYRITK